MTITIDATIGGPTSNSFIDEADAIAFAATRLNLLGWATVTGTACTENEKKALIEATRELSAIIYRGLRSSTTQALAWPRRLATDPDLNAEWYPYFADDILPQRMQDATCELAIAYLAAGTTDIGTLDSNVGVIRETIDVITTQWAAPSQRAQGLARFPRVIRLIAPLFGIGTNQVRLTR
jgi:hypothetical protein